MALRSPRAPPLPASPRRAPPSPNTPGHTITRLACHVRLSAPEVEKANSRRNAVTKGAHIVRTLGQIVVQRGITAPMIVQE